MGEITESTFSVEWCMCVEVDYTAQGTELPSKNKTRQT